MKSFTRVDGIESPIMSEHFKALGDIEKSFDDLRHRVKTDFNLCRPDSFFERERNLLLDGLAAAGVKVLQDLSAQSVGPVDKNDEWYQQRLHTVIGAGDREALVDLAARSDSYLEVIFDTPADILGLSIAEHKLVLDEIMEHNFNLGASGELVDAWDQSMRRYMDSFSENENESANNQVDIIMATV